MPKMLQTDRKNILFYFEHKQARFTEKKCSKKLNIHIIDYVLKLKAVPYLKACKRARAKEKEYILLYTL
jgi:hypothetical protein